MISKYIHKLRFRCNGVTYNTTIEDDNDSDHWKDIIKRVKIKIFNPVNIVVISSETFKREEYDCNRDKVES